jgi:HEPN domain-containing protein
VIEKALKALYVKKKSEIVPRTHNLIFLSESTGLTFDEDIHIFMGILMKYQLQGRYPDYNPVLPDYQKCYDYLEKTEKLLKWLKEKLLKS